MDDNDDLGRDAVVLDSTNRLLPCDIRVCSICVVETMQISTTALGSEESSKQARLAELIRQIENVCTAHSAGGTMQGVCTAVEVLYSKYKTANPDLELPQFIQSAVLNHIRSTPVLAAVDTKYEIVTAIQKFGRVFDRNCTDAALGKLYVEAIRTLTDHGGKG